MNNQFVSFEIASKLKDLGFDERCLAIYYQGKLNNGYPVNYINCNMDSFDFRNATNSERNSIDIVTAPLWQQVIDWFREKHQIQILEQILDFSDELCTPKYAVKEKVKYQSKMNFSKENAILHAIDIVYNVY